MAARDVTDSCLPHWEGSEECVPTETAGRAGGHQFRRGSLVLIIGLAVVPVTLAGEQESSLRQEGHSRLVVCHLAQDMP